MSRLALLAVATGLIALTACAPDATDPGTPGQTASQSPTQTTSPGNDPQADMRTRLAAGLRAADNPTGADLVADPATKLEPTEASWLDGWQVIDVQNNTAAHPRRFYAGLADSGTAVRLSGNPDGFATMVRDAGVRVDDAGTAVAVVSSYLDVTRDFQRYSYRIDAVSDISFKPSLSAEEQQRRAELEKTYGGQIGKPTGKQSGTDWAVQAWTVNGTQLIEHSARVAADGSVSDTTTVKVADLPVPQSV